MDMKRMQHVVALAEERNFRKAAERVHLTQPAFSRSIQAAEDEWGLKLFDRGGGARVGCTAAGTQLVERIRRVVNDWRALERDVLLYRDQRIGDLALCMGPFTAATLLMPLLLDLRKHHPGVRLRVQVNNLAQLLQHVRSEELEFFFGDTRVARSDPAFDIRPAGTQPGFFYVRSGHPLLARGELVTADIARFGLATARLPAEVQALLAALMGRTPQEGLPVAVDCDDVHLLKSIALATDTVLTGTPGVMRQELEAGLLHQLAPTDMPVLGSEVGVVSLKGRTLSPMATYAIGFLTDLMARQVRA
jgi:DNA-binding transcriptional LysR family regulator